MATGSINDDIQLLYALRSPQRIDEGIRYLYDQYFIYLSSYVTRNGGSSQDAEDIFLETMVSFISVVDKGVFRGESSVKTFLYSMLRHAWANVLKKRDRRVAFYYDELSIREILQLVPYENEQVVRNKKSKCLKGLESLLSEVFGRS